MKKNKIEIDFYEAASTENMESIEVRLINKAKSAARKAYAPYSGFSVGAAVLLENGEIITGSNQENAAYPSGVCAERTALYYAGSTFPDVPVKTMAITALYQDEFVRLPVTPCGTCRQVILETQRRYNSRIRIIMFGEELIRVVDDVICLLPFPFDKVG
ncbi:MAG TPA: cytidine deaminase [Bacteroidales bacterium]|nr:cytidine deaminase [Bacteroidales bacterium]